jgi:hypothetical protein
MLIAAAATATSIDWSAALTGVDLNSVLGGVYTLVPLVLPVIIAFVAFRKAFGFLKGALHGA